jgi:hypothetical protein
MAEVKTNLRVLRPSRKKVRAGDVFAMQMPDDLYLFGRLISTDAVNIQPVGSRCVRSGVESPAYSAIVHPFFRGRSLINAAMYFLACRNGSTRPQPGLAGVGYRVEVITLEGADAIDLRELTGLRIVRRLVRRGNRPSVLWRSGGALAFLCGPSPAACTHGAVSEHARWTRWW